MSTEAGFSSSGCASVVSQQAIVSSSISRLNADTISMWLAPIFSRMVAVLALITSVSAWVTSVIAWIACFFSGGFRFCDQLSSHGGHLFSPGFKPVVSPFLGSFSLGPHFFPQEFQHLLYIHFLLRGFRVCKFVANSDTKLSRVGCITRQVTSRHIQYSEFIPLALTFTPFTILQLLPSTESQLLIL
jgi:hypothetical protein